ncbi:MAG: alpha/beta hydrolase, partial [Ktedonobacterales bacterium]|nr:alpha/beta hydrolase [Ktedonobacterales bacterium]
MLKLLGRGIVLCALLMAAGMSVAQPSAAAQAATSHFTTSKCGFTLGAGIVAGRDVRCGYLTVPENRAHPVRSIRIAVAIFTSVDAHRASDPLIFLQGGPGGAIVADVGAAITAKNRAAIVGDHDLILVDQRGTGLSQPPLSCPEVNTQQLALLNQDLTPQKSAALYETAMAKCHTRLVHQGIDLSGYTTYNNAADVHDLILALGYPAVDIYGVSYGTRVALEIERSFPQHVRSVILDSSVPTQLRLQPSVASARTRVYATLFAGCQANANCNKKYPNLQGTFTALVARLNTHPLQVAVKDTTNKSYKVLFKGADLYDFVWQVFYVSPFIKYIPDVIHQVSTGDTRLLGELFSILGFDTSTNLGVYYSVECAEGLPYTSPSEVTQADMVYPAAVRTANT